MMKVQAASMPFGTLLAFVAKAESKRLGGSAIKRKNAGECK